MVLKPPTDEPEAPFARPIEEACGKNLKFVLVIKPADRSLRFLIARSPEVDGDALTVEDHLVPITEGTPAAVPAAVIAKTA